MGGERGLPFRRVELVHQRTVAGFDELELTLAPPAEDAAPHRSWPSLTLRLRLDAR